MGLLIGILTVIVVWQFAENMALNFKTAYYAQKLKNRGIDDTVENLNTLQTLRLRFGKEVDS